MAEGRRHSYEDCDGNGAAPRSGADQTVALPGPTGEGRALVIVAKYPRPGQVKTRLAGALGADAACALYRAFLSDMGTRFQAAGYQPLWAYTPPGAPFGGLVAEAARCFPQVGPDLGTRLRNIFRGLLAAGWHRVAIVSSDTPHLPLAWLVEAYAALDDHDLVLGPATDGGYSLIAMTAAHDVFTGVEMGTERVLAQTLARARGLDLRVRLLPPTFDIDEPADLERLWAALADPALRAALPRTSATLATLRARAVDADGAGTRAPDDGAARVGRP